MKTITKVLLCLIALVAVCWIAFVARYIYNTNTLREYSTYCMDNIRSTVWGELENVYMGDAYCADWTCIYIWWFHFDESDYAFSCKVYNKENVDLNLQPYSLEINTDESALTGDEDQDDSIIIVFSPTWNTKQIATYISEIKGNTLEELLPMTWYTEEDLNWRNEESRSFKEFKDTSIKPEIATEFDLDWYDTIYLWYPIWFGRTPNIITTFLDNYDLSGKNVILFCTSEHVWIEWSVEYLEPYKLNVIASKRFEQGSSKEQVQEWLESL